MPPNYHHTIYHNSIILSCECISRGEIRWDLITTKELQRSRGSEDAWMIVLVFSINIFDKLVAFVTPIHFLRNIITAVHVMASSITRKFDKNNNAFLSATLC